MLIGSSCACKEAVAQLGLPCVLLLAALGGMGTGEVSCDCYPFLRTGYSTHLRLLSTIMTASTRGRLKRIFFWHIVETLRSRVWLLLLLLWRELELLKKNEVGRTIFDQIM